MKQFKLIFIVALSLVLSLSLAACSNDKKEETASDNTQTEENSDAEKTEEEAAPTPEESAGFEEFPLGDDIAFEPYINVAGVYFQPVDMYPDNLGLSPDKSNMHIEADISALEGNGLGFGKGDWVPFLTVECEITEKESGKVAYEGTFMPMSASDGPHYGANINLEEAGTYMVKFIIKDPSSNGYVLHVDETTGVERHEWWPEPLVAEWEFNYTPNSEW